MRKNWAIMVVVLAMGWSGNNAWGQAPPPGIVPTPAPIPQVAGPDAVGPNSGTVTVSPGVVSGPAGYMNANGGNGCGDPCQAQHGNFTFGLGVYFIKPAFQ